MYKVGIHSWKKVWRYMECTFYISGVSNGCIQAYEKCVENRFILSRVNAYYQIYAISTYQKEREIKFI